MPETAFSLGALREDGKSSIARLLSRLERGERSKPLRALLDQAWAEPRGIIIGVTGPPGVGKSTLLGALVPLWREKGLRVAVLAVDPSSRASGGALLGDRTRINLDHGDGGTLVRSMAARRRLGGLAAATVDAAIVLRALFDIVVVETVGVGQSETDVASIADTVLFCIQPASGDSLQFMKSGVTEIPHIMAVTKADIGNAAETAASEARAALHYRTVDEDGWKPPVCVVSAIGSSGIDGLAGEIERHEQWLRTKGGIERRRRRQTEYWLREKIERRFGSEGLACLAGCLTLEPGRGPFECEAVLAAELRRRLFRSQ